MRVAVDAVLLRVFVGEEDRFEGRSLYQAIVATAIERRMAGATVLPGSDGFGVSRSVRTELNIDAGPRSPMVVEIVDADAKVNEFLAAIKEMIESGLVTMERVRAIRYRRPDSLDSSNGGPSAAIA